MSSNPYNFKPAGTIVKQKLNVYRRSEEKVYWFESDQISGKEINLSQALTIVQGIAGRKLTQFEWGMLMATPFNGTLWITIATMLAVVDPDASWPKSIGRTVVGYVRTGRRSDATYGGIEGSEGFYLTDGTLVGELTLTRRQEPGLISDAISPIDLLAGGLGALVQKGVASLLERGAVIAFEDGVAVEVPEAMVSEETATVGRWMNSKEYDAMVRTGRVQESPGGGPKGLLDPPDPSMYRAAPPGDVYVEFDVPKSTLEPKSRGQSMISGPNSPRGRLAVKKGLPPPEMPRATNITIKGKS